MIENTDMIITLGFPIALTCFLLLERQGSTREMIKVLHGLKEAILILKGRTHAVPK